MPGLDLQSVDNAVRRFYSAGLASSTKRCYSSGQKRFLDFCEKHRLQPIPPDEHTILRFISQLGLDGLAQATIQNYLGAIQNLLISAGVDNLRLRTPRVELVLRGIKRVNSLDKQRKPGYQSLPMNSSYSNENGAPSPSRQIA
jgi:hypothetical protein